MSEQNAAIVRAVVEAYRNPEVMRQVARWYDVEIVFEGKVPHEKFDGEIPRSSQLSDVLKILQLSNVHFKIENSKVTVTP